MEKVLYRDLDSAVNAGGMADSRNNKFRPSPLQDGKKHIIRNPMLYYIVHSIFTTTDNLEKKNKMATKITAWLMLKVLGWSAYFSILFLSILPPRFLEDIQLSEIKEPWKTIVIIFGLLWIAQRIYVGYQNGRGKKIENDEREHELQVRKKHEKIH